MCGHTRDECLNVCGQPLVIFREVVVFIGFRKSLKMTPRSLETLTDCTRVHVMIDMDALFVLVRREGGLTKRQCKTPFFFVTWFSFCWRGGLGRGTLSAHRIHIWHSWFAVVVMWNTKKPWFFLHTKQEKRTIFFNVFSCCQKLKEKQKKTWKV